MPNGQVPQNYNAEDVRSAMAIADREQGKQGVMRVSVQTVLYSWHKSVNVSADGSTATSWNCERNVKPAV
jgi:hypothetical protein